MRDWPQTPNEHALVWAVMVARDRIAELESERDKWEWVARGVIKEDPGEAFNDPDHWCAGCQATLDHFLATWEADHD